MYFTNSMRNKTSNNLFVNRNASTVSLNNEEKHRFWLNLSETDKSHNQVLIGYTENATNDFDLGYDGKLLNNGSSSIYSLLNDESYVIQAKGLPFTDEDIVPLGFKTENVGTFIISLGDFDGLFEQNQTIFLKDKSNGIVQNLNEGNYTFNSAIGEFNNRFEIVYKNSLLSNSENIFNDNSVLVFENNNILNVNSSNTNIKLIKVYDTLGRLLITQNNINNQEHQIKSLKKTNTVLLLQIEDINGKTVKKKVIF